MNDCIFCDNKEAILVENELAYVIFDEFPVTDGHLLIIPKSHVKHYFDLTEEELLACHELIIESKEWVLYAHKQYKEPPEKKGNRFQYWT